MIQTRSGRLVKKPNRYEPTEIVEDDYVESDDDDCTPCSEVDEDDSDSDEDEDDSDADENGNLKDFIVDSDSDSESDQDQ
jgi:DNA-directed RNA polymerase subunit delta